MIIDANGLENRIQALGREIYQELKGASLTVLDAQYYSGKLLNWAMQNEEFKVSLFRFVDVFPSLGSAAAIVQHAQEYFEPVAERVPGILKWGLRISPDSISAKMAAPVIARQIRAMASRFIAGETPQRALAALKEIRRSGMAFTVDLLGEANLSEQEAAVYCSRYLDLLRVLAAEFGGANRPIVQGHRGDLTPLNISVKLSALYSQARPIAARHVVGEVAQRLTPIVALAQEHGAYVCLDMEDTSLTSIALEVFKEVLAQPQFSNYQRCSIVLQAYLKRSEEDLDSLIRWARARGVPIGVRLVKGAYWDTETILAEQRGWPLPVFQSKAATDACYERMALKLLTNHEIVFSAFASHNLRTLCAAVSAADLLKIPQTDYELQALYGMAEPIKKAFVQRGFLVREYAPIGELIPGMGYLVRRLLENTSNEGFLRQTFYEHEDESALLAAPAAEEPRPTGAPKRVPREEFRNAPLRDFSSDSARESLQRQIDALRARAQRAAESVKPVSAGRHLEGAQSVASLSPEDPNLRIAEVALADAQAAEEAVRGLHEFFPVWRDAGAKARAEVLFRAGELLDARRDEISAAVVLEAGKPWMEADADVAEAVDFCNYYALEALRLDAARRMGGYAGEMNSYHYEARGVALVVAPWNFPAAIPCGMFAAALVAGNTVALKPSTQTCLVARIVFESFLAAGMPERAASFLPASGRDTGSVLVRHPLVSTIAFTGSKEVGLGMIEAAGATPRGFAQVKRVIAEMGGKNAIIVDDDADLDEAVRGVVYSAFGYAGQKCSACSRVIVVGGAYERFVERLSEAVKSIIVGAASDPRTFVGPVIDEAAQRRISSVVEEGRAQCRLLVQGGSSVANLGRGWYVQPAVFSDLPPGHRLLTEEIFGPVLAVLRAKDFGSALASALDSEFALTGAVFSRSPSHIEQAAAQFRVGNLYINRGCTGALVMRQPFGGFKMSGVGSKAGGPDYLQQFMVPRCICENTMRRGFAPKS